jgi:hypothetical protein
VIPEFFYKPIYDENPRRFRSMSTMPGLPDSWEQKGFRERLLCWDCEQQFGRYENYARKIIYGGTEIGRYQIQNPQRFVGIDYGTFKLFQLSLLWRASVSRLPHFGNIDLGPHESVVHQMLLRQHPGKSYDYGCVPMYLVQPKDVPLDKAILAPEKIYSHGFRGYRFMLAGCLWLFVVSGHIDRFPHKELFLQEDGTLTIVRMDGAKVMDWLSDIFGGRYPVH